MEDKIRIQLTPEQIDLLSNLPEQGMGYQVVDIKLNTGIWLNKKIVIDSSILQLEKSEIIEAKDILIIRIHKQ